MKNSLKISEEAQFKAKYIYSFLHIHFDTYRIIETTDHTQTVDNNGYGTDCKYLQSTIKP